MYISQLKIKGFRSFGPDEVTLLISEKLVGYIGANSAGKTTALEALKKLFGASFGERELFRQDFHIGKDENAEEVTERELSIEVRLDFTAEEKESIPVYFSHMVVDEEGADPFIRIRLEATWQKSDVLPDGEIESSIYFIKVAEGEEETPDNKHLYPKHFGGLIQVLYVPAIRKPAEQLRYASGTILYRVLRKIKWEDDFKDEFDEKITGINDAFKGLPEFNNIQDSINSFWKQFHKDERYKDSSLGFGGSDIDSILKKLEVSFSPTGTHKSYTIDELGEGYRSLFYLTLVCALLDVEKQLSEDSGEIGIQSPLLTILAIEEPENHIAPQLLGRVIKILGEIAANENVQVFLSSHTPAIVKRINPEALYHFRINDDYATQVANIELPPKADEAYKYIKEAVQNYPEIYFAKLVVIGEGDSEDVIFRKLMEVMDTDFDDNIISFAPLGHRFVNHIWKLLNSLNIPYITLLDLDLEREGGGWGRVKYVLKQLIAIGKDKDELLATDDGKVLTDDRLEIMHTWASENLADKERLLGWADFLKNYDVFFSKNLDLDFLMLQHYPDFYKKAVPEGGGPRIPDKVTQPASFDKKVESAIQATLKSEEATAVTYSEEEKELMIWYNYLFLGRGKPSTHIQVMSSMSNRQLKKNLPGVFTEIFDRISTILKIEKTEDEED